MTTTFTWATLVLGSVLVAMLILLVGSVLEMRHERKMKEIDCGDWDE